MPDAFAPPDDLLAHAAFVRRLARTLLRDPAAADDLAQDTWTAALEHPPHAGAGLRAWLARVARNAAHRRWRTETRRSARETAAARSEALPGADAGPEREEALTRVVDAVRSLDEPHRRVVLARYYEGLAPRAIAEREGIPVETVHTRLQRALERLRGRLGHEGDDWRASLAAFAGATGLRPEAGTGLALGKLSTALVGLSIAAGALVAWRVLTPDEGREGPRLFGLLSSAPEVEDPSSPAAPLEPDGRTSLAAGGRSPLAPPVSAGAALAGRVLDEDGEPIAGASVYVLGDADPFGAEHPAPQVGWNAWRGRSFETGPDGSWRAELPEPGRVLVALGTSPGYARITEPNERWVDAPADGLDWRVRRVATGVVEVRVFEGASRRPLPDFRGVVRGDPDYRPVPGEPATYTGGYHSARAEDGVLRLELSVEDPAGRPLLVQLSAPASCAGLEQVIRLLPGETEEVVFVIPERGVVRGLVVDASGAPVEGALVFFGPETLARGDEPFRPLREDRILDGVRSGPDGWFELRGDGDVVTALHAALSPATVPVASAGRIELGPRGAIRGRWVDEQGRPLADRPIRLDDRRRGPEATTGPDGSFAFEGVEAGAHALWDDDLLLALRLEAGEQADVVVRRPTGALELELVRDGVRVDVFELDGLVVGLDRRFGLYPLRHWRPRTSDPSELDTGFQSHGVRAQRIPSPELVTIPERVLPGRYWMATRQGVAAAFTVHEGASRARVELGSCELVVRARSAGSVQVVPADADAFTRLAAARARVELDATAAARFSLPPGRYALVGEAGAVLGEVVLDAQGAAVELE